MTDILRRFTQLKVVEATNNMAVEANCVYTIPPNRFLRIERGRLYLSDTQMSAGMRMPIDYFFRSLAEDQHEQAVCVLLSGSGSDGTLGLREVRAAGGLTIVQKPETAQFDSMLRSAIATGMVDLVLPLREIGDVIQHYVPQLRSETASEDREKLEQLDAVLDLITTSTGSDFSSYKKATLLRRTERRMALNRFDTLLEYLHFLRTNPPEIDQLAKDMLIGVSSFFRDPEAFEELRHSVIAPLIRDRADHRPIRVWIPGCSTGEEAYSIVILLLEEMIAAGKDSPLQVFASDLDTESLKIAREGQYPLSIAADVSEERLNRFFTKQDSHYQVVKRLRESVIFSVQNLLNDAPFSRLDLISCRNVLIYIDPVVQRRLISLFAFALSSSGYLFLGKSDAIASQSPYFTPISAKWRIYSRTSASAPGIAEFNYARGGRVWAFEPGAKTDLGSHRNFSELCQEAVLKHFDASVVLIDEHGTILYFFGPTSKYIEHPTGEANVNLFNMIDTRLAAKLRIGLRKAIEQDGSMEIERAEIVRRDVRIAAKITVSPLLVGSKKERLYSVVFEAAPEERTAAAQRSSASNDGEDDTLIAQLESELRSLKNEYQLTINEYETSGEELKAANEEILSINEELQSTNEELETSKEEIQSVNEELNTVNSELNAKIDELSTANNDLLNFVNSSEIATVFLDRSLRIKRFTPPAAAILNVIASDVGRPLAHLTHIIDGQDLVADADEVMRTLIPIRKEVRAKNDRIYVMSLLPYRTSENKIDGIILTFIDITAFRQSEISMQERHHLVERIINSLDGALLVLDQQLRVVSANRGFHEMFGLTTAETLNRSLPDIGNGEWKIPELLVALQELAENPREIRNFQIEPEFSRRQRRLTLNVEPLAFEENQPALILLAVKEMT